MAEQALPGFEGVRLDGNDSASGMLIPAHTVLEYLLEEPFSTIRGLVGIDDRLRPSAAARFTIQVEDQMLGEFLLRGDEPAQSFELALPEAAQPQSARRLRLIVDFVPNRGFPASIGLVNVTLSSTSR